MRLFLSSLIGQFQHRVKFYADMFFRGRIPGITIRALIRVLNGYSRIMQCCTFFYDFKHCLCPFRTNNFLFKGDLTRFCMNTLTRKDSVLFSFIDGFNVSNAYIAAQGPLNINNELFWQFAWKQGVAAIVVLSSQTNVIIEDELYHE